MKYKDVCIATKNQNKVREIQKILANLHLNIHDLSQFGDITEPEEDGNSFKENALIKASYYFDKIKEPVIADDSGLVVTALDGAPGIYSSRFAGENASDQDNNQKLLNEMKNISGSERSAYFICFVCFKSGQDLIFAEGKIHGTIGFESIGTNGFGYDPLFIVPRYKKTFAELSSEVKNSISHRYHAFLNLSHKLKIL